MAGRTASSQLGCVADTIITASTQPVITTIFTRSGMMVCHVVGGLSGMSYSPVTACSRILALPDEFESVIVTLLEPLGMC